MNQKRVLSPSDPWWQLDLAEVRASREVIWFLFRRDFLSEYKQTVAGPFWFLLHPLGATVIFTVIFGTFAGLDTQGMPPFLFYHAGLLQWTLLQGTVTGCSSCLLKHAGLYRKIYFPRLIAPMVELMTQFWRLSLNLLIFIGFYLYFLLGTDAVLAPGPELLLLPFLFLVTALLGTGVGLLLCAISVKYRDVKFILPLALQFWMFLSPVMYSNTLVQGRLSSLLALNPTVSLLTATRVAFTGQGSIDLHSLIYSVSISLALFMLGVFSFQKAQQTFVDRV
jgi:lipopolysaccharide transport system permease protein